MNDDREALIRVRRQMLDKVGAYFNEDLADPAGECFGVRFDQEWRYPKFQFDTQHHALPEMKPILAALSPDEQGWSRLQWFLEPHEVLRGRTPLDVWKRDRQKVIEAAATERWNGRD